MDNPTINVGDKITEIASKQLEAGLQFKQPRMKQIQEIEEMYLLKKRPALEGRYNIPFDGVILRGYAESTIAKTDEQFKLRFKPTREEGFLAGKKVTALADQVGFRDRWSLVDRWGKKMAFLTGRAIFKAYAESVDGFKFQFNITDHYDFVCEPNGGGNLNKHLFQFEMNNFRGDEDLKLRAKDGVYDQAQVNKLLGQKDGSDQKQVEDDYKNKAARFATLGMSPEMHSYVGDRLFNLVEGVTTYKGEKFYVVFDQHNKIWVRCAPLKEVFQLDEGPWVSWSTDEDPFNFWNLGPADSIFPVAEGMRINLNGLLNNARKRGDDMSAYDMEAIEDPAYLNWRPDGLVPFKLNGRSIDQVVRNLAPTDITGISQSIHQFLNSFLGENVGITPGSKGASDENTATQYLGNIQQVADRLGLKNRSFSECQQEIGTRFVSGADEHLDPGTAVKLIGIQGVEWAEITNEDLKQEYEVVAEGGSADIAASQAKAQKQRESLELIVSNPVLVNKINPRVTVEEVLRFGEFPEEKIASLLDTQTDEGQLQRSEAARAIRQVMDGKQPRPFRAATTGFIQHIIDFIHENDLADGQFQALTAYAEAHMEIATRNMLKKAQSMATGAMPGEAPMPAASGAPTDPTAGPMASLQNGAVPSPIA